jgi:thymidine kinase
MLYRADPWLHVIAGCMSSGKTDELLRLLRRAEIARRESCSSAPTSTTGRPASTRRAGARRASVGARAAQQPVEILSLARERDVDLVGIEEAQFFDPSLVQTVETLRQSGRHVIASGLNTDFAGRPFGPMPELLALADDITMLSAICVVCGETATRTQRLVGGRPAAVDDPLRSGSVGSTARRTRRRRGPAASGTTRSRRPARPRGVVADDTPERITSMPGDG